MEYGRLIDDALSYTGDGILRRFDRWVKLILATILLQIPMGGYIMRIYRGAAPAPEVDGWGSLVFDGLKLLVLGVVYAIPVILVWIIAYAPLVSSILSGLFVQDFASFGMTGLAVQPDLRFLVLMYILEIALAILFPIAAIRLARTDSFAAGFHIGEILQYIGRIGWLSYILALIVVGLVVSIPVFILMFILGIVTVFLFHSIIDLILVAVVVFLIIAPPLHVFQARYMTRVFDSVLPENSQAIVNGQEETR